MNSLSTRRSIDQLPPNENLDKVDKLDVMVALEFMQSFRNMIRRVTNSRDDNPHTYLSVPTSMIHNNYETERMSLVKCA